MSIYLAATTTVSPVPTTSHVSYIDLPGLWVQYDKPCILFHSRHEPTVMIIYFIHAMFAAAGELSHCRRQYPMACPHFFFEFLRAYPSLGKA